MHYTVLRKSVLALLLAGQMVCVPRAVADEGMWPVWALGELQQAAMQHRGCQLTIHQIYNATRDALSDAIVIFGDGCSSSFVSQQGLLFTNHHCGRQNVQELSSLQHNYLVNGFYAQSLAEELHAPDLTISVLDGVDDVTSVVLKGLTGKKITPEVRKAQVADRIATLEREATTDKVEAEVVETYDGEAYVLVRYLIYKDVRLVSCPPEVVGNFGGDTDNWTWPNHNCDFSVWRVYASRDNEPAVYSNDNVPYRPRRSLKVNAAGPTEGGYAMTIGFPGGTQRYQSSMGVRQTVEVEFPELVAARAVRLGFYERAMEADSALYLAYADKHDEVSNYYKNFQGVIESVGRLDVVGRKEREERAFVDAAPKSKERSSRAALLAALKEAYERSRKWVAVSGVAEEGLWDGSELTTFAAQVLEAVQDTTPQGRDDNRRDRLLNRARLFYDSYDRGLDSTVCVALYEHYVSRLLALLPRSAVPTLLPTALQQSDLDHPGAAMAERVAQLNAASLYADSARLMSLLRQWPENLEGLLAHDPAQDWHWELARVFTDHIYNYLDAPQTAIADGERRYFAARRQDWNNDAALYPDANFTKRLSYGVVEGLTSGGVSKGWCTNASELIGLEATTGRDHRLWPVVKRLVQASDFGPWADHNGKLHCCFLTTNDITGGNSGSPVLDAHGELIGLAFDGNWEAMSCDILYEPDTQRTICLDVRYLLWVLDRLGHQKRILDEVIGDRG